MLFKTKAIILHLEKNNKNEFTYTIFSQEYGKILLQKK
jgi:recombinational DNA repair protein (RecF pathway)